MDVGISYLGTKEGRGRVVRVGLVDVTLWKALVR